MNTPKITLYCLRELHLPVLMPVYEALIARGLKNIGFTAPIFSPGMGERAEEGLRPETLQMLKQRGIAFWGDPRDEKFGCVITADACYDRVEGWGPVLCVGHGTISKNIYFIDNSSAYRENYASVLCVPGPWYTKSFGPNMITQCEPTGFPKMDDFAKDWDFYQEAVFARTGFSKHKKTILFAPTYNPEFTGMEAFYAEWLKLDPNEYQVLFKLHGAAAEEWRQKYRQLAASHAHFYYVEDPSLIPYMFMSELMVSDLSSAYLEFMVLDKPIVLYNNPLMTHTGLYNPEAVEFQVRSACEQINHPSELIPCIQQAFIHDAKSALRRNYTSQLFPQMDGQICQNVAQIAYDLAYGKRSPYPPFAQPLSIYIPPHYQDLAKILVNITRLSFPYQVYSHQAIPGMESTPLRILGHNENPPFPCAVLRGDFIFSSGWDWALSLARHFAPNVGIALPMLAEAQQNGIQQLTQLLNQRLEAPQHLLQAYAKYNLVSLSVECHQGLLDGVVFSSIFNSMPSFKDLIAHSSTLPRELVDHALQQGSHCKVLIGHYGY